MSTQVFFFFDDSGVLHRNEATGYFVYAGYVFIGREELETAKRKYIRANKAIKRAMNFTGELKAAGLNISHKRSLYNVIREYESVSAEVNVRSVYDYILNDKKSICRYKDYILKLCIKSKLSDLIKRNRLSAEQDIEIFVNIDEQLTATNGYYDLRSSIREELRYGIVNWNYGVRHPNIFHGDVQVFISYCESKNNYLIQASDIIANRIWTSYRLDNPNLRDIPNHLSLTFP